MFQRIEIIGDLGKDPEMRYTPAGQPVTNFSVATTNTYTKGGEQVKDTIWFRVSVWGSHAEACKQYLDKGSRVFVDGRIKAPHVYQKEDKTWDATLEINAATVKFLDKRGATKKEFKGEEEPYYDNMEEIPGFAQ